MKKFHLLALLFVSIASQAQNATDSVTAKDSVPDTDSIPAASHPKSYFSLGMSYLSNSVYNGRKDSLATPYLTPSLGYYDKSGFFVSGSLSYLMRSGSSRIDLFSLEAGYDFTIKKFDGEIAVSKSFYNDSSTNVKSQISASVYASGGYDLGFIKPSFDAAVDFGSATDFMLGLGLEHSFYAANDNLEITPTFMANGSTQNYYGSYYNKRRVGGKRKTGGIVYDVSAVVENASQFKMLDYELSLPLHYTMNKFGFSITPVYAIPVNPAVVTITRVQEGTGITKTRSSVESISSSFYCSFGITWQF